jgi:hypothetical protein
MSVVGKSIRKIVTGFIKHPSSGQSSQLRRPFFRLRLGLSTSEAEDFIHRKLVSLARDFTALEIAAVILS